MNIELRMSNTEGRRRGRRRKSWLISFAAIGIFSFLIAASPLLLIPPGIDEPEPIGPFLNNNFPATTPTGLGEVEVVPAFSTLRFDSPMVLLQHPTADTLFVAERGGHVYFCEHDSEATTKTSFMDVGQQLGVIWDAGLLGFVLHPNFGQEGQMGSNSVFVFYTTRDSSGGEQPSNWENGSCSGRWYGSYLILSRWELEEDEFKIDPNSEQILLKLRAYNASHRGGGLTFGPDGFLYLTIGDQYRYATAQTLASNLDGSVLRLDVDQDSAKSHPPTRRMPADAGEPDEITGQGYLIPNDNPFVNPEGVTFEEYFTIGHRAPHRLTMDKLTGELYMGEVGLAKREELNHIVSGGNYGWPLHEGNLTLTTGSCGSRTLSLDSGVYTPPLVEYLRHESVSLIGGFVYRGNRIPALYGKYISADYYKNFLHVIDLTSGSIESYIPSILNRVMSIGEDRDGELYLLSEGGNRRIFTLKPSQGGGEPPQWLSETGAFSDLDDLIPAEGVIPYEPHVPFWSDGAAKRRWLAIPNDGTHDTPEEQIQLANGKDLHFPPGAVFIKHFDYPIQTEQGMEMKKLETRFIIHGADSQYYFLTYHWLPDGSDAELVLSGKEEEIVVDASQPLQTITWTYPSVSDCGSCHSASNGMVLGASMLQLNSDFTYPQSGETSNQLLTYDHLGMLNLPSIDPAAYPSNAPTEDQTLPLEFRARSYLDVNCAYCHQPDMGNRAIFDARLETPLEDQDLIFGEVSNQMGIDSAFAIFPGDPERSILYQRLKLADHDLAMPPLAKNLVDEVGTALIREWIESLDPADFIPPPEPDPMVLEWGEFVALPGQDIMYVSWSTFGELEVDHFLIHYSKDGDHFSEWMEVPSQGNNSVQQFYSSPHTPLQPGQHFYLVEAIGKDGSRKFSDIFSEWIVASYPGVWVFPNPYPRSGPLTIEVQLPQEGELFVELLDLAGRRVWKKEIAENQPLHRIAIYPASLQPGIYVVQVKSGKWKKGKKILVE